MKYSEAKIRELKRKRMRNRIMTKEEARTIKPLTSAAIEELNEAISKELRWNQIARASSMAKAAKRFMI
jgi:hypothetical protein